MNAAIAVTAPWPAGTAAAIRPIAVVIVCRNPGTRLQDAIASVRALDDPRTRLILIDGASTDGSVEVLRRLAPAFHHWVSEADAGIYDAMNKGWRAAPDDAWVLFLGADDRLLALPSADELTRLEDEGCDLVFGRTWSSGSAFRSRYGAELHLRNTLHHQSLLVRKAAHPTPPFDPALRIYGDWEFNLRLFREGRRAAASAALRAEAAPLGVSAVQPLAETFRIARRHGNSLLACAAWALAAGSRARRGATRALRRLAG
jgi:glycosyltransferase involved in cell wall biosynthesis